MATACLARATWRVLPTCSPALVHHCRRCGVPQGFRHDGCFRVNANGRRLDVWLRHACDRCGQTWHVPVAERVAVDEVAELDRFERDDPALIELWSWALSRRHPCAPTASFVVETPSMDVDVDVDEVVLEVPWPVSVRVDRLLAQGLGVSRTAVRVADRKLLRRPVVDGLSIPLGPARPGAR